MLAKGSWCWGRSHYISASQIMKYKVSPVQEMTRWCKGGTAFF
jgi:hypothetical protein